MKKCLLVLSLALIISACDEGVTVKPEQISEGVRRTQVVRVLAIQPDSAIQVYSQNLSVEYDQGLITFNCPCYLADFSAGIFSIVAEITDTDQVKLKMLDGAPYQINSKFLKR